MIEEFSDEKDFYEKCIVSLIENLYGKLTIEMNKKPFKDFDVDTLNKFNIEIDSIKNLFTKLTEPNPIEVRFIPNYLKALKLQIEGKLFILNYKNYSEFDIHIGKRDKRLNELINSYSENSNADVDVLNGLLQLKNKNMYWISEEDRILQFFEREQYVHVSFLFDCFRQYPILELDRKYPYDLCGNYKCSLSEYNKEKEIIFLNEAVGKYLYSKDIIIKNGGSEKKAEIYEKIISLINKRKMQLESEQKIINKNKEINKNK